MCTSSLHCFDEYCLSRFHYAQLFLGDGITFDHNHKINKVTLTTCILATPVYIINVNVIISKNICPVTNTVEASLTFLS